MNDGASPDLRPLPGLVSRLLERAGLAAPFGAGPFSQWLSRLKWLYAPSLLNF